MIKLAVFGNPIQQSKSPTIHKMFAEQCKLDIDYQAILAPTEQFTRAVEKFLIDPQARGCNVTSPFKVDAHAFADELSEVAKLSGAVNTLSKLKNGKVRGDNTDGGGLVNDILSQDVAIQNSNILIIGAGGAARGVLPNLLKQQPAQLTLVNRTVSHAETLIGISEGLSSTTHCKASSFESLVPSGYDIVINATTLSLNNKIPNLDAATVSKASLVYDMAYKNEPTAFLQWSTQHGARKVRDGLGMLVGQAALSFQIWTGHLPKTDRMLAQLRVN